jgi:RNA polymerase sigma-70 factor (ECF subfamily)
MPQEQGVSLGPAADFRRIFDDNYRYVWSSLRRLGVLERDLEDVTHDVFLQVHAKLASYDRALPIRPWLFAFALRFASDYRKLARHPTVQADTDGPDETPRADEMLEAKDRAEMLRIVLDQLSLELRAVLILHDIDETPMKEIAASLQIPLNTGYSRLRLAREQCAACVARLTKKGAR